MSLVDKAIAMAGAAAAAIPPAVVAHPRWSWLQGMVSNDLTTAVIGAPLTTVAGAVLGTFGAIGYDDEPKPRGKLFVLAMSTTIFASALVGVIPAWMGWTWANGGVASGLGALAAVVIYYGLPPAILRGRELIRNFSFSDLIPGRKAITPPPVGGQKEPEQ